MKNKSTSTQSGKPQSPGTRGIHTPGNATKHSPANPKIHSPNPNQKTA